MKKFRVMAAPQGEAALSLTESLEMAKNTGVIKVPAEMLSLNIPAGQIEVEKDGSKKV